MIRQLKCAFFNTANLSFLVLMCITSFSPAQAQETRNLTVTKTSLEIATEQRVALVIGNSAYRKAPLLNPSNDAQAMASALTASGFSVLYKDNATYREMTGLIRQFGDRLRSGGVGVFYYAGHGMQIKGHNYLVPVDSEIEREDEVAYSSIDANLILEKMEAANNRMNIVILDACRNNPFVRNSRSGAQGLAQMEAPVGTLIAFSTSPGSVASDGNGKNGLYTSHLLKNIKQPGLRIEDVFKHVRFAVRQESGGKQIPWEATSLEGDFYFTTVPASNQKPPVQAGDHQITSLDKFENSVWETIKDSVRSEDYEHYLDHFPNGKYAKLAMNRIAMYRIATLPSHTLPLTTNNLPSKESIPKPPVSLPQYSSSTVSTSTNPPVLGLRPSVGDSWEYAVFDGWNGRKTREEKFLVEKINTESIEYTGLTYQTDETGVNPLKYVDGTSISPRNELVQFPLEVGKQWSGTFISKNPRNKIYVNNYKTFVLRKERISVAGGTFDTFCIEQTISFKDSENNNGGGIYPDYASGSSTQRLWFAPEVKRFVKTEYKVSNPFGKTDVWERTELMKYQVH